MARQTKASKKSIPRGGGNLGQIKIERRPVADLLPAGYNPRVAVEPGSRLYEQLQRSLQMFGYAAPIVWNKRSGRIVGGHQRLSVMIQAFGVEEVDVRVVDLSDTQEKALNVALNKIAGDWDTAKLASLLRDLDALDDAADVTALDTGYNRKEITDLLDLTPSPGSDDDGDEAAGGGAAINSSWSVIADCANESEQRKAYDALKTLGIKVRVNTLHGG